MGDGRPIGVFDSGIGGLTVLKALIEGFPNERFVYFGDCARIPYGTKSRETVLRFARQDVRFLMERGVKAIVCACNTISASALSPAGGDGAMGALGGGIPFIDVIRPDVSFGVGRTASGSVGVICTQGTKESGIYPELIGAAAPDVRVSVTACPLFVQLAEEGWWDGGIVRAIAERYLSELLGVGMDVLLLGCTHYPLLADAIRSVVGGGVELVSSGAPVAAALGEALGRIGRSDAPGRPDGGVEFYTSDSVERFQRLSSSFLGREVGSARWVDIEGY